MTREEEIKQELKRRKQIGSDNPIRNNSFLLGALWADAHPVNPWRKVSEELPEPLVYVIVRFSNNTMAVSQRTNHFIGETTTVKATHWMSIPKIKED